MESEFPSNSKTNKPNPKPKAEEKKVARVTTGEVIQRKKSLGRRFKETFISGADSKSVFEYVSFEILIPAAKDLFLDAMNAGMERKFFGEARSAGRRGYGRSGGGHTAYNRMGSSRPSMNDIFRRDDPRTLSPSRRARANHDFGEIVLETRAEGIEVIDSLFELISKYEVATVSDLYDMVNVDSDFTDNRYGWVDLRGADVVRVRDGYLLNLPRPEPID